MIPFFRLLHRSKRRIPVKPGRCDFTSLARGWTIWHNKRQCARLSTCAVVWATARDEIQLGGGVSLAEARPPRLSADRPRTYPQHEALHATYHRHEFFVRAIFRPPKCADSI